VAIKIGNLVRWVSSHSSYEANGDVLVGIEPIYKYGVIVKISKTQPTHSVVAAVDDARWHILDMKFDAIEVISDGVKNG